MKALYPKADGFVFQTADAMAYYKDYIGDRGVVLPNAINNEFVKEPYKGKREKVIVSAGRFSQQKNHLLLIDAFSKISQKHCDYNLVIYGDGELKSKYEERINELKIKGRVFMPGFVHDFGSCILNASLFVLSSNFEGMPNALMEAMALGLPCISTDCPSGGPKYLINDRVNGLLVPLGDSGRLAEAMDVVLSNEELAYRIGNNARRITETLRSDSIYEKWEIYIKKIIYRTT
jgi:glycosyltransferase involved in cell wall biosynthesis